MRALTEFATRIVRRILTVARSPGWVAALLRDLGPYAAIELVLPGGTLLALLLWFCRRRLRTASA